MSETRNMPKPDKTKRIGFWASLALHLFALALALAIPWACAIREKKKPPEPMKLVQIPISIQAVPAPNLPVVEPPQTVSIPEPVKHPIHKPKAKPAPKPKQVEKQTNRVTKVKTLTNPTTIIPQGQNGGMKTPDLLAISRGRSWM